MTDQDVYALLSGTGIYTAREQLKAPRQPPYAVYLVAMSEPIASDHVTVGRINSYRVELYTGGKDCAAEKQIEDALSGAGIIFSRDETTLSEHALHETIYAFDLIEVKK